MFKLEHEYLLKLKEEMNIKVFGINFKDSKKKYSFCGNKVCFQVIYENSNSTSKGLWPLL